MNKNGRVDMIDRNRFGRNKPNTNPTLVLDYLFICTLMTFPLVTAKDALYSRGYRYN